MYTIKYYTYVVSLNFECLAIINTNLLKNLTLSYI